MPEDDIHDLIVIGAGPAGAEAALAAAGAEARTLCLAINLDTVGYPPGSPLLAAGADDPRRGLLEELEELGAALPRLLETDRIARTQPERILTDRRRLGLAYKELLENAGGIALRQALAVSIQATDAGWRVDGKFGERFEGRALVIAAGTFLAGQVMDGDVPDPAADGGIGGGRRGEIPANALAKCLQYMGFIFTEALAAAAARVDARPPADATALLPDDERLKEAYGEHGEGGVVNKDDLWVNRPPARVSHLMLAADQVSARLESLSHPGLFFAGRAAGASGYVESAALGTVAGRRVAELIAAGRNSLGDGSSLPLPAGRDEGRFDPREYGRGAEDVQSESGEGDPGSTDTALDVVSGDTLIKSLNFVSSLCLDIAAGKTRPVSVRRKA